MASLKLCECKECSAGSRFTPRQQMDTRQTTLVKSGKAREYTREKIDRTVYTQ